MNSEDRAEVDRLLKDRGSRSGSMSASDAAEVDHYLVVLAELRGEVGAAPDEAARIIERVLGKDRVKANAKPSRAPDEMPAGARF
jgi:hypothetical protein